LIVLGVDPGTAATGYGVVSGDGSSAPALLECGVIRTTPSSDLASRLLTIHDGLLEVISRHCPTVMAVESVFHSRNARTTLVLGHARGVILLAARLRELEVVEYPPAEIKKAIVGTGMATKEQVQFMVARLLRLKKAPEPSDAADGVAAALAYLNGASLQQRLGAAMSGVPAMRDTAELLRRAAERGGRR
jgi:crossover junction endodeoxyribonuclease RuvC